MYNIRKADKEDYPELIRIWYGAVSATHDFLAYEDFLDIQAKMPQYLDGVDLYVACEREVIRGFIGLSEGNIEMLFVADRGRGTGSRLLEYATGLGADKVDVNEQNSPARYFYGKHGFVEVARSKTDSQGRPYPILHMELKHTNI